MKEIKNKTLFRLFWSIIVLAMVASWHWYFSLTLPIYMNRGVSLGLYFDGVNTLVLILLIVILFLLLKKFNWGLYLVWCGGLVNFINRLMFGYVFDYFNLGIVSNNLPDFLIFAGIVMFLFKDG